MSLTSPFPEHASWSKSKTADMLVPRKNKPVMLCARRVRWAALKASEKEEEKEGGERAGG